MGQAYPVILKSMLSKGILAKEYNLVGFCIGALHFLHDVSILILHPSGKEGLLIIPLVYNLVDPFVDFINLAVS